MKKLKLLKGTRFTSALFITVSLLIAAGIIWGANTYYDIDAAKIIVNETQRIVKNGTNYALEIIGMAKFGGDDTDYAKFSTTGDLSFVGTAADVIEKSDAALTIRTTGQTLTLQTLTSGTLAATAVDAMELTGGTNSKIDFPNFDVATTGHITVQPAYGLDVNASGILALGNTTATTVNIGNTAATTIAIGDGGALGRTINIGTGTGIDTIKIGTGGTAVDVIDIGDALATVNISGASQILAGTGDPLTITANAASTWSTSAGLLSLTGAGGITLTSTGGTLTINAAGQTVDLDATTLDIDTTGVISLDGADSSNFTVTGAGKTLTLAAAGGTTNQVIISSAGTGANAIYLNASAGGLDVDSSGAVTINTTDGSISLTAGGAVNGDLTLTVGDDFSLDAVGALTMEFGAASGFKLQNDAGSVVHLEIDSNGKVTIKSETNQDIVLDPGGTGTIVLSGDVAGDDVMQGLVPIFGFDLPAQTKSATYKTVSRVLESDPFPAVASGMTRKYKFVIRYADELAAGTSSWSVCPAATADASCTESFTVPYSTRTLSDGSTTADGAQAGVTNLLVVSSANFNVDNWIFVDNAGTDYWARITVIPDGTHITVLTAVSADAAAPVKEYTTSLDNGNVQITGFLTTAQVVFPWRLAVTMDGTNSIRIYQIFLAAYDTE